nr:MAG TPA: hypothetical protein [Caudoviricetes sp.]
MRYNGPNAFNITLYRDLHLFGNHFRGICDERLVPPGAIANMSYSEYNKGNTT